MSKIHGWKFHLFFFPLTELIIHQWCKSSAFWRNSPIFRPNESFLWIVQNRGEKFRGVGQLWMRVLYCKDKFCVRNNIVPIMKTSLFFPKLLPEVESRTQGSRPRPRTQKKSKAKDSLSEDRHSRGQGHKRKCSPKKKKGLHKHFSSDLHKKTFSKKFFKRSTKF